MSDNEDKITITNFITVEENSLIYDYIESTPDLTYEKFKQEYPVCDLNDVYSNIPNQDPVLSGTRIGFYNDEDFSKFRALIKQLSN